MALSRHDCGSDGGSGGDGCDGRCDCVRTFNGWEAEETTLRSAFIIEFKASAANLIENKPVISTYYSFKIK